MILEFSSGSRLNEFFQLLFFPRLKNREVITFLGSWIIYIAAFVLNLFVKALSPNLQSALWVFKNVIPVLNKLILSWAAIQCLDIF